MLHPSDKELDLLSQEAARQYDPGMEHSPGSWEKLEQQLIKDLGRTRPSPFRGYRRIPFLYAPIVVLLVGVSYFLVKQGSRPHGSANSRSDTASLAGPVNGSPPRTIAGSTTDRSLKKDQSPKIEIPGKNSTTENTIAKNSPAGNPSDGHTPAGRRLVGNLVDENRPAGKKPNAPFSASGGGTNSGTNAGDNANKRSLSSGRHSTPSGLAPGSEKVPDRRGHGIGPDVSTVAGRKSGRNPEHRHHPPNNISKSDRDKKHPDKNQKEENQKEENRLADNGNSSGLSYSTISLPAPAAHPKPFIDDSALKVLAANIATRKPPISLAKKDRSLHINKPLQIGLLYGPDFTTVKSVIAEKPGHSLGLTLGYQIINNLSINTGLLWTHKNYTALADDFHPPSNSWFANNNLVHLDYVEGSVDMLEIPLNIRYDFKMADNSIFYLSGGASSYLVGQENCLYFYENFGMNRRAPEKQNDPRNYWFAALNLAMGIEKPISNSFSIQAEPYLKLPLSGVGIGNVQLNSFGINLSVKYTPLLGKSRH